MNAFKKEHLSRASGSPLSNMLVRLRILSGIQLSKLDTVIETYTKIRLVKS